MTVLLLSNIQKDHIGQSFPTCCSPRAHQICEISGSLSVLFGITSTRALIIAMLLLRTLALGARSGKQPRTKWTGDVLRTASDSLSQAEADSTLH